MKKEVAWWLPILNIMTLFLKLSCWNPLKELELRRSIKVSNNKSKLLPVVSIGISILCIKIELDLYVN